MNRFYAKHHWCTGVYSSFFNPGDLGCRRVLVPVTFAGRVHAEVLFPGVIFCSNPMRFPFICIV
jgi:hypothetical protein